MLSRFLLFLFFIVCPNETSGRTFNNQMAALFGAERILVPVSEVPETIKKKLHELKAASNIVFSITGCKVIHKNSPVLNLFFYGFVSQVGANAFKHHVSAFWVLSGNADPDDPAFVAS